MIFSIDDLGFSFNKTCLPQVETKNQKLEKLETTGLLPTEDCLLIDDLGLRTSRLTKHDSRLKTAH